MKVIETQACSFYGFPTWELSAKECDKIFKSWNVLFRTVFKLHRCTHRYLIEEISKRSHIKKIFYSRYFGFMEYLRESPNSIVRYLFQITENDKRTKTGRNKVSLLEYCKTGSIKSKHEIKRSCQYFEIPDSEMWIVEVRYDR